MPRKKGGSIMSDPNNITKFMAWMDLYYEGDNEELLHARTTENGERCFECFVPVIEKQISGVDKNHEKAFDKFFNNFAKEVDEYVSERPDVKINLDKQIIAIKNKSKEELQKQREKRKDNPEYQKLKSDISTSQFNAELDMAMDILNKAVTDVSLTLDENPSTLYIKILGRDYFPEDMSDEKINIKMNLLCSEEARKSNNLLLFAKCRVTSDAVILIGVVDQL